MAKKQIGYGSTGAEVKELQQTLNSKLPGYNLAVDGIFGNATKKAVQDFQKQNKLAVDGIVGNNTWAALLGNTTTKAPASTNTAAQSPTTKAPTAPTYQAWKPNEMTNKAEANLNQVNASKPGDYKASNYQTIADEALQKYMDRKDFSYDLNGDALYQQYKDKYIQQGKMAMQDTMGQATAMTGGYGNSYAATVGNQAYQASLENLNDIVPELYQMAYDRYNQDGQNILNQYSLASERENQEYAKYRDAVADWNANANRADSNYWNTVSMDYSMHGDKQNYDVNAYQTALDNYWQDKAFGYQQERGAIADSQWQKQFDETVRQYNKSLEQKASTGVVSQPTKTPDPVVEDEGGVVPLTKDNDKTTSFKNSIKLKTEYHQRGGKGDYLKDYVYPKLEEWLDSGKLTESEAAYLMNYYGF